MSPQACLGVVVFAHQDRYPVFHHLRKFPDSRFKKIGVVDGTLEKLGE